MKRAIPFILIALAIIIFFMVIDPQYEEVKRLMKEKEDNDTMLTLAEDLQRKRDALHDAYNAIGADERERLAKLLPDTVDNVRLILDINNVAEQWGVPIKDISVTREGDQVQRRQQNVSSTVDASGDVGTITLSFSVDANYETFMNFIRDLEEALRIVDIRALEVSAGRGDGVFYNFSITLDTYWLR